MNKMTFDTVSISSDDDVPLKVVEDSKKMHPLSFGLRTHSLENCEFCDAVSLNKYDALIHNAKHIIIPLLKQKLHQCSLCLFYFTSRYKLKHHIRNKHKNDVVPPQTVETNVEHVNDKPKPLNGNDKPNNINDNDRPSQINDNDKPKPVTLTKATNEKVATKYEPDDEDDLPLLIIPDKLKSKFETHGIEETEKRVEFTSDVINEVKEKLLKDVKVVLDKCEPEVIVSKHNLKLVHDKLVPKLIVTNGYHSFEAKHNELKLPVANHSTEAKHNELKLPVANHSTVAKHNELKLPVANHSTEAKHNELKLPITNHSEKDSDKPDSIVKNHNIVKLSNRLRFEDDFDDICDEAVMKDLTTDCLVDMTLFDEPWVDEIAKSITDDGLVIEDDIVTIDDSDTEASTANEITDIQQDVVMNPSNVECNLEYPLSIHHEELIKPGVFRCKRCQELFPTRFNQIQHEMQHIRIRKPRPLLCEHCDRFIPTKKALKEHIALKHLTVHRARSFKICKKCGLKYNCYDKHLEIYHVLLRCHLCNKAFENEVDRLNHIRGHLIKTKCAHCDFVATDIEIQEHQKLFHKVSVLTEKTFNLCELCCLFLKNKNNNRYVFGETVSELGTRLHCEHCGNKFFHLTQVKRFGKGRPNERFTFEKEKEKKKARSNTERLKNIQQRLKMINKLSRF